MRFLQVRCRCRSSTVQAASCSDHTPGTQPTTLCLPHCTPGLQVRVAQPGAQQYGPDGQMHQRYLVCQVLAVESRQPGYYK